MSDTKAKPYTLEEVTIEGDDCVCFDSELHRDLAALDGRRPSREHCTVGALGIKYERLRATVEALDAARSALATETEKREAAERERDGLLAAGSVLDAVTARAEAAEKALADLRMAPVGYWTRENARLEAQLAERFTEAEVREAMTEAFKTGGLQPYSGPGPDAILDRIKKGRGK